MADCCSRRCRGGDSSSSQISVIHWCSYSQVGRRKRAGYVCVCICSLRAPHAVCFALCVCSCSAWVGRRNRCNDEEPEPAQPKLNSGEPNEWGGKAFWPIAAVKSKLQRRVFPCADAKWLHRDAWRSTKFLFLFEREDRRYSSSSWRKWDQESILETKLRKKGAEWGNAIKPLLMTDLIHEKPKKDLCVCVGVEYQFHESLVDMIRQANPEGCVIY